MRIPCVGEVFHPLRSGTFYSRSPIREKLHARPSRTIDSARRRAARSSLRRDGSRHDKERSVCERAARSLLRPGCRLPSHGRVLGGRRDQSRPKRALRCGANSAAFAHYTHHPAVRHPARQLLSGGGAIHRRPPARKSRLLARHRRRGSSASYPRHGRLQPPASRGMHDAAHTRHPPAQDAGGCVNVFLSPL